MAQRAVIVIDAEAQDARKELARLRGVFPKLKKDAVKSVRAVDNAFEGLTPAVQQSARSIGRMNKTVSGANQVLFTAGDAAQDIGIAFQQGASAGDALGNAARFAGNNLAFGAEQVSLLVAQAGSGRAAMSALATSMLGAGGVIVGIQLLVSILPQVISALNSGGQALKRFKKALDDIDILSFADDLSRLEEQGLSFLVEDTQAFIDALDEQEKTVQDNIRAVRALRGAEAGAFGAGQIDQGDIEAVARLQDISEEQAESLLRSQKSARNALATLKDTDQTLEDLLQKREAINKNQEDAEQRLSKANALQAQQEILAGNEAATRTQIVELLGQELNLTDEQTKALKEQELTEQRLRDLVDQEVLSQQQALDIFKERLKLMEEMAPPTPERLPLPGEFDPQAIVDFLRRSDISDIGPVFSGPPPEEDEGIDALDQQMLRLGRRLSALRDDFKLIQAEAAAGLIGPLTEARAEANNLRQRMQLFIEQGVEPSDPAFQKLVTRFRAAQTEAAKLALAMQSIQQFSRGIGEAVSFAILGDPKQAERLRERQQRLQERLSRTDDPQSRQQIREDIAEINRELERFETLQGRIAEGFERLGDVASNVLSRLISDLATAAATAAILSVIPGLGQASFSANFLGVLVPGLAHGGLATGPTFAMVGEQASLANPEVIAPLDQLQGMMGPSTLHLEGELRARGGDLVAVFDEARSDNTRRGI